jgi:hypothetical protein
MFVFKFGSKDKERLKIAKLPPLEPIQGAELNERARFAQPALLNFKRGDDNKVKHN